MAPSKNPAVRLRDIVHYIDSIAAFTAGMDSAGELKADEKTSLAVLHCLLIISECAAKLGDEASVICPGVPWPHIRALGNRIRHQYDDINPDRIWTTVRDDLPPLRAACLAALAKIEA